MTETLDILPGEGDTVTTTKVRTRRACEECGETAHLKVSLLLDGARSNPASKAYRKDNCSWCSDLDVFSCRSHENEAQRRDGYQWCSTFPATAAYAHMFLFWKEIETK